MDAIIRKPRDCPAGKHYQAACLYRALCPFERPPTLRDALPEVAPLLSQPVVEACLRIPLYTLMHDGRDRALARDAFAGAIPEAICHRQGKGGLEEHAARSLHHNLALVRPLLLEGHLVDAGLLDRHKVADALTRDPTRSIGRVAELMEYTTVEAWLRSWLGAPTHTTRTAS
jgi:asparagine synthase (glutamine-hydrolysing)